MAECVLGARAEPHLVDEFCRNEWRQIGFVDQCGEQLEVEAGSDGRRGIQRPLGIGIKTVDAGADGGVQRGRHIGVFDVASRRVGTGCAVKYATLG